MSQAERIVAAPENHLFDDSDPSQTLDNCGAVIRFLGDAADSIQHNGGAMHGPAIGLLCWLVADALDREKTRSEKLEEKLLARVRKAEGGVQ